MRKLDHIVMPVRDLDAARRDYAALGFKLTPPADHPWGTRNSLAQIGGAFLELLAVVDPSRMEEADFDAFSFGAFNRDFLTRHEGISMLALAGTDAAADRADFHQAGLPTYAPFSFERIARQPDGSERKVAFDLTFTTHPDLPDAGFFTCHNRFPENFWKPDYLVHENGAARISAVVMVAPEPAEYHEFLERFTGQRELRVTSFGIECDIGDCQIDILTPVGFKAFYGDALDVTSLETPRFVAVRIDVDDIGRIERDVEKGGIAVIRRAGMVVVPAAAAHGSVLIFRQAR